MIPDPDLIILILCGSLDDWAKSGKIDLDYQTVSTADKTEIGYVDEERFLVTYHEDDILKRNDDEISNKVFDCTMAVGSRKGLGTVHTQFVVDYYDDRVVDGPIYDKVMGLTRSITDVFTSAMEMNPLQPVVIISDNLKR